MDPETEAQRYINEHGVNDLMRIASRYGASQAAIREVQRRDPSLSATAASLLVGRAAQSVAAGRQLADIGTIATGTLQGILRRRMAQTVGAQVDFIVEISDKVGNSIRHITVRIDVTQQMDEDQLARIIYQDTEQYANNYGIDLVGNVVSYEILGVFGV